MVRLEAPPVNVEPPPKKDRVAPWLTVMAVAMLVDGLLPWERWCGTSAFDDETERCFSATIWGGSASLLGLLATALSLVFVIASLPRLRSRIGPLRLVVFTGAVASIATKLVIVSRNASITAGSQGLVSPTSGGFFIGLIVCTVAAGLLITTLAMDRPRRGRILAAAITIGVVVSISVPYARSGLAWWGGPLADPTFLGGGNGVGLRLAPDESGMLSGLLYFRNPGAVAVSFDGLELLEGSRGIDVLGTYAVTQGPCEQGSVDLPARLLPDGCAYPLAGFRFEPGGRNHIVQLVMVVDVQRPGVYRSGWIRVRYHAGMLPFEIFRMDTMVICAPEPGRKGCPGDGF